MEKTSSSASTSVETHPMDESLEFIFTSMMHQGEISDAMDFLRAIDTHYIPSKTTIQTLIFQILMKCDDARCLGKASSYLVNLLKVYPPSDEEHRQFYSDAIQESHGFLADLWNVFDHIVKSYFIHHKIYVTGDGGFGPDPIKYPNCKYLLDLYVRIFAADYEYVTPDNYRSSLLMNLLWPGGEISKTSRYEQLMKWINDIYCQYSNQWASLLRSMHELLNIVVKFIIHKKHDLVEVAAFNDSSLADIVEDMANFCKNALSSLSNVKLFLSFLSLKCLQARVSEKIIRMIMKQNNRPFCILTLKEIVDQHMFPSKFNKWKNIKPTNYKEKNLRKRTTDKSVEKISKVDKTTVLHQLCKEDKFADLIFALKTHHDKINARDNCGCTPLHIACQAGNYGCVKSLVNEAGKGPVPKLDFTATNNEGLTPLHIVVSSNNLSIVRILLESGGSDILYATDFSDRRPSDLDCSEEMEKLLKKYQTETSAKELDSFVENSQIKEAPVLKTFKEYSIYLTALTCLLCGYSNLFQLYHLVWQKTSFILDHNEKMCSHYVNDSFACSEDAALLPELPNLLGNFVASLYSNVSKLNINIDLELLPLKQYSVSICRREET